MQILLVATVPDPRGDARWHDPARMAGIDVRECCVGVINLAAERCGGVIVFENESLESLAHGRLRDRGEVQVFDEAKVVDLDAEQTIVFFAGGANRDIALFDRIKHWPYVYPVASTGKAATYMLDEIVGRFPATLVGLLRRETVYSHVARMSYLHATAR